MPVSTDSAPRPLPCPAQRYSISLCQAAAAVFGAPAAADLSSPPSRQDNKFKENQ